MASREGLGGGVGDQGTSFGPFQLHVGGALPRGRGRGWAESPAGIDYALRQIGGVARGLHGSQAVNAIVRRFERPANPDAEVSGAIGALGQFGGGASAPAALPPGAQAASAAPDASRQQILQSLIAGRPIDFVKLATQAGPRPVPSSNPPAVPKTITAGMSGKPGARVKGALAEAFYDPIGSWDNGKFGGAIGGHSDHVHLSITNAQAMLEAIQQAKRSGLRVGENPYTDRVDPVHVKGSYHYRDFPGMYGGRRLGEAIDVSGAPAAMAAYYRWATRNLR